MSKQSSLFQKFVEKFSFADEKELIITLKATAFKIKDGEVTNVQMTALLIVADQYGLNPFTREIFAYPDKQNGIVPVVSVDGWSRIINQHPDMDGLEFIYDEKWVTDQTDAKPCPASIECVIFRKDRTHPVRIKEFLDEVYRAPSQRRGNNNQPYFVPGPWQTHTKRMLRHKSLIQCARIAFGFTGIYDQDEAERIIEGQAERIIENETQAEASERAKQMLLRLIKRATQEGSWQAALEYAGETFSGFDLDFMRNGLKAAKVAVEVAQLPAGAIAKPGQASALNADPNAKPVSAQQAPAPKTDVAQNTDSASDSGKQAQDQNATVNRQRKTPLSETRATLA